MYEKWLKQLEKNALFKNIDEKEIRRVLSCMKPSIKNYKKKDIITIEKEPLHAIGIILEGEVLVGKEDDASERMIMAKLKRNDIFGEIAAYTSGKWPATVTAEADTTILFLAPEKVVAICGQVCTGHKVLIENMLNIIANKALKINEKIEILTMKSVRKKITHYLLQQERKTNSLSFEIPLNRNELAEYLDITRPSLSRELARMQEEGLIAYQKNHFEWKNFNEIK